jgi:hypothetical protein
VVACLVLAAPLRGQEDTALAAPASLHKEPDGVALVTLPAGAPVEAGRSRGGWNEATVEGWIYTNSTERTRRDGYDLVVTTDAGENLRRSPNGPVVGRVREGTLLERVTQKGGWTRVRRNGWIPKKALRATAAPRAAKPAAEPPARQAPQPSTQQPAAQQPAAPRPRPSAAAPIQVTTGVASPAPAADRIQIARDVPLGATPAGGTVGTASAGTTARIVARSGDLVKVQVEGWIPADAVAVSDSGALVGVSAAEVHAEPARFIGQTLEWRLQVIAVKAADELRSEMPPGQPYLLTRGPLPEPGFVYVIIPSSQAAAFRALPPLQEVVLRVAIRAARTRFLTTPVAELVSVVSGMESER